MTSPESKRAKGIRSPRQKKRSATGSDSLAMNPGHYKDPGTENLSQLSDIVSREGLEPKSAQCKDDAAVINLSQQSQQSPEATQDHAGPPDLPSQPDIPMPAATASLTSPALVYTPSANGAGTHQQSPSLGGLMQQSNGQFVLPYTAHQAAATSTDMHIQDTDPRGYDDGSRGMSKATRRGPMDEMRQLVRILVKIIPHSVTFLASAEEGGGGNRISEERIKYFLDCTLGEAPRPSWGVPQGWGEYLAELFTWISEQPITRDQAMRCAKREPGRSWEAITSEIRRLSLNPMSWPLPLSREGLRQAAQNPVSQPMPSAAKRAAEEAKLPSVKRKAIGSDPETMSDLELWQLIVRCLHMARKKMGPADLANLPLQQMRQEAQALMADIGTSAAMQLQHVPVMIQGANGQQVVHYISMAGLQGVSQQQPTPAWPASGFASAGAAPSGALLAASLAPPSPQALSGMNPSQIILSQPSGAAAYQALQLPSQPDVQSALAADAPDGGARKPQAIRGQHQHEGSLAAEQHMMEEPSADISRLYETGNALYRPQPMKAAVNPPAPTQAGEEGTPQPAASDAGPTPIMPVSAGGLQSLLLDPSTLSSLYGAMGTSSGAFLALSQLPGINMDAVQGGLVLGHSAAGSAVPSAATWAPSLSAALQ
ncbi:hypothetical protein CVIRNUC_001890 [Coccomyxa viridis]|uniref:Uncharacterized protein n=1 Tax=Coccomyxa viridis TaxID=1274662 RepID=A0AAV1HVD5_9CHLO|nr:hypothetical protein CVIRNUC_001890 [Coccomyxa viridis]